MTSARRAERSRIADTREEESDGRGERKCREISDFTARVQVLADATKVTFKVERVHALGALSDDLYETARARLLEEIAATPAAAPAPAPTNREGDRAVAITALPTEVLSLVLSQLCLVRKGAAPRSRP